MWVIESALLGDIYSAMKRGGQATKRSPKGKPIMRRSFAELATVSQSQADIRTRLSPLIEPCRFDRITAAPTHLSCALEQLGQGRAALEYMERRFRNGPRKNDPKRAAFEITASD